MKPLAADCLHGPVPANSKCCISSQQAAQVACMHVLSKLGNQHVADGLQQSSGTFSRRDNAIDSPCSKGSADHDIS